MSNSDTDDELYEREQLSKALICCYTNDLQVMTASKKYRVSHQKIASLLKKMPAGLPLSPESLAVERCTYKLVKLTRQSLYTCTERLKAFPAVLAGKSYEAVHVYSEFGVPISTIESILKTVRNELQSKPKDIAALRALYAEDTDQVMAIFYGFSFKRGNPPYFFAFDSEHLCFLLLPAERYGPWQVQKRNSGNK